MEMCVRCPPIIRRDPKQHLRRKSGIIGTLSQSSRDAQGLRSHHKINEEKILPHRRAGLDDFEVDKLLLLEETLLICNDMSESTRYVKDVGTLQAFLVWRGMPFLQISKEYFIELTL